jgi:hypothetical protein
MMLPAAPASPGVGVREDDGHDVSSEASNFLSFVYLFLKPVEHYIVRVASRNARNGAGGM